MNKKISMVLESLEYKHQIKIIYACEAGSRAWGLANERSDYDIRFLYVYPTTTYLRIDSVGTKEFPEVIEKPISDSWDISGWELTKALRLFRKSNPSLLEWIHSPIVYKNDNFLIKKMKDILPCVFNPKACIMHYTNMAKANLHRYEKNMNPQPKDTLSIIKPIIAAKWINKHLEFHPLHFSKMIEDFYSGEIKKSYLQLAKEKRLNLQLGTEESKLIKHAITELAVLQAAAKKIHPMKIEETRRLDELFRNMLDRIWG
ncbi:nucleotidyltransferase domain-containing protein [Virgibacillus halodenitrificans]|uniref:nucleotidyltransferase domain-containing protein n=2 Tax=Virgibacillus halodenitrificans TaxID=1482 RepID=UPI0024C04B09|nr:nucleotidyltransferase domain-containing protein [Virgibacillus halodenitrificans]WHX26487.1 nucleotidyltransferase domain-containing protein [Virgibacillus halodenitrificans]